jgi:hypothetical protein
MMQRKKYVCDIFTLAYENNTKASGCGVAQTIARRLAGWQARVRISARHPRGGPLLSGSNEEIKSGIDDYYI